MGTLDAWLRGGGGDNPWATRRNRFLGGARTATTAASNRRLPKSAIERIDISQTADDLSRGGASLFGTLGRLPSRVMETPVSLVDVGARMATGGRFSPVEAVGQTPAGGVFGFLGEAVERAGNFVPALINSEDARRWSLVFDKPDDTPMTPELLGQAIPSMGLLGPDVELAGGFLGIGSHIKTVGEFRQELQERGFFYNPETGAPIDPGEMGRLLRGGGKSTTDFGYAATNDNALVDLAGRLATDPTNALFFVPGANLAKLGATGARVLSLGRLVRAGAAAERVARPIVAAEAIARGNAAQATVRGMARFLRGYRTLSIGTAVGNFSLNRLAELAPGEAQDTPFLREIAEFTAAVENNQPMSNNAAFMLFSAATFPYGQAIVQPVRRGLRAARSVALGRNDLGPLYGEFGGRARFDEQFGGPDGSRQLVDFVDVQIARDSHRLTPGEIANIQSIPHLALRRRVEQQALGRIVQQMRDRGEITGDMRLATLKEWHSKQGGFEGKGVINPWDAARAARRWRDWQPVRQTIKPLLDETGEVIWGLRDDVLFVEQVDAARAVLRAARTEDGTVPVSAILDVLEDSPNLNSLDNSGFWARFGRADAQPPTWRQISNKLGGQKRARSTVRMDDYLSEMAAHERKAPADIEMTPRVPRQQRIEELRAALSETTDETGTIRPDRIDESQTIQRDLEGLLAEENGIHWARMGERDKQAGTDPALARQMTEDAETLVPIPRLAPGMERLSPEMQARVAALEREVTQMNPSYRVKRAPMNEILALVPDDAPVAGALRARTAFAEAALRFGPLSGINNFFHALTRHVGRDELARGARQALMDTMIPHGAKPTQVKAFLGALEAEVRNSTHFPLAWAGAKNFAIRQYRDIGSVLPGTVNRIGAEIFGDKVAAALGDNGFYRALSRANSRYWRGLERKAQGGDRTAKGLKTVYDFWNDAPVVTGLATVQRTVAKYFYPLIRFTLDPRWLGLNAVEANILSLAKDGYTRAYRSLEDASPAARYFQQGVDFDSAAAFAPDSGWSLGRQTQVFAAKSFDVRSIKSAVDVINDMGANDPALVALRSSLIREAQDNLARAQRQFKAGDLSERSLRAEEARANKQLSLGQEELATHLNDTLYRYETQGVDKTITEEVRALLRDDEIAVMRPLIDKIHDNNRRIWADVQDMLHGNPSRSTLERIMNSYWFYWPISYQIKATKWLADIMLNGSFGHNNGALLAGKFALWEEQHRERIRNNPAYAAMFEAQPTLWFAAQMVLPMSPDSIGVSLGRATRLAGTAGQGFVNEWLGTEIGVFTASQEQLEPANAIRWLTEMGPLYTAELAERFFRELDEK